MKILLTQELANERSFTVEESYRFTDMEPVLNAEIFADFHVSQVQEHLFHLTGHLEGTVHRQCDRCCSELDVAVRRDYRYTLRTDQEPQYAAEHDCSADDCETIYLVEPIVQSEDIIREQLLLAVSGYSLCNEDCKGLCERCGINLNEKQCECGEINENSPFAILQNLQK